MSNTRHQRPMTISGFTFVRNAEKLYFPIKESILSVLPLVDEFVVALGNCDADDHTEALIAAIGSPKIKIVRRVWDKAAFVDGKIYRDETNFALSLCKGDWCLYIQADEVLHEQDLKKIKNACQNHLTNPNVEGFLFDYKHFWGDYDHCLQSHCWYKHDIRLVRNHIGVQSIKDAQSFRHTSGKKLNVLSIDAAVYHYGWVRPPQRMQTKKHEQDKVYWGKQKADRHYQKLAQNFDYGDLNQVDLFAGTHPKVMAGFMAKMDWHAELNFGTQALRRPKMKHERFKYRFISWIERHFFGQKSLFGYKNWHLLRKK